MSAQDRDEIIQLKYRYFRHLDLKEFEELGELLTDDCTAAYDDGKLAFEGRAAIIEFLSGAMGNAGLLSKHQGHHPEIAIDGDGATGTWYLEDTVIIPAADLEISGTAFYADRYEKVGGSWKIAHTGYQRVFEEHRTHSTGALSKLSHRFGDS